PDALLALAKSAALVGIIVGAAWFLVPWLLEHIVRSRSRELFLIAVILIGTLTALGTSAAGASLALGAFLAGLIISESDYGYQALAELMPFRDIFISVFFVAVGMLVQLDTIKAHLVLTLIALAVIMSGKTLSAAAGPALMGYSGRVALLAGVAVSQIGEFSFVLAKEGRIAGLLPDLLYQQFLGVAVITMLVTPFLLQGGPALLDAIETLTPLNRLIPGFRPRGFSAVQHPVTDHVVIAGYGLNGRNLGAALRSINAPYLIVELNAQTVRKARAAGEPAFYGDATREEILRALGIERARLLVIAISDPAATRRMVRVARESNPKLYIIARTRYVVEIPELTRLGANAVIPEEFETSIEIFARVLAHYNVPSNDISRLANEIRASHYQALRPAPGEQPRLTLTGAFRAIPQMQVERIVLEGNAPAVGQTIAETQLRSKTGALILAVRRGDSDLATPDADFRLEAGDGLVVVGQPQQIKGAYTLLTGAPAPGITAN
ncbi:MAG: NAD-binding protein, partial [Burkholderiales bacterium]